MNEMFCFQCEQTANCSGCTGRAGVCGKSATTARLQDELTGALVSLARAASGNENLLTATTHTLVQEALFTTLTNVSFNEDVYKRQSHTSPIQSLETARPGKGIRFP